MNIVYTEYSRDEDIKNTWVTYFSDRSKSIISLSILVDFGTANGLGQFSKIIIIMK